MRRPNPRRSPRLVTLVALAAALTGCQMLDGFASAQQRKRRNDGRAHGAGPEQRPRSLYVHVPFCVRRCAYCDFAVQAMREAPTADWLDAVTAEMRLLAEDRGWDAPLALDTVYVGGGTPSLLEPDAMARLRERLAPWAGWDDAAVEWTCEANPESFTPGVASAWRAAGVNRLSLGAQPALRAFDRRPLPADVRQPSRRRCGRHRRPRRPVRWR